MVDNQQRGFFFVYVTVLTLLCTSIPASSFSLPRITRTDDAIIIDFAVVGKSAHPAPLFNPYTAMMQHSTFDSNGWSYSYAHPSRNMLTSAFDTLNKAGTTPTVECGRGPTTFPTSRTGAAKNVFPFVVTLSSYFEGVICGGTLISESKVLLATQCLQRMSFSEMSFLSVLIGMTTNDVAGAQITRRISRIVLHGKFNAVNYANDIAIVTLDSPVTPSRTIWPICLPPLSIDPDQYADQDAIILGWGGTTDPDTYAPFLDHGKVKIVSNMDCRANQDIGRYVTNTTICTDPDRQFACSGNVGSPVVVMSSPGNWTVVGINTYYKDCTSYALETSVAALRTWIDTYIN